ncbi:H-NS family nucleoid-associated regulatory protein [Novilysobacter arseniciresistens]|uniref:H-NS family nucleoid-associated regulatory protein n=1 Tax=Novilysobacter arseniciresistens TaxID=1385522 RepID=UPI0009DDB9B0|nr:H-NS family nucleoid-associated regulatory protein [Lysobacter arseniciresistens]
MAILNDFMRQLADAEKKAERLRNEFNETVGQQARASFEQIKEILDTYMRFLTQAQRNSLMGMLQAKGAVAPKSTATKTNAGKKFKVEPKYQLPTGETWTGRGQGHKAFIAWSATPEGKAWHKANPDEKYPAYPFGGASKPAKAAKKAAKKASKASKATKGVKRAAKGPAKKARKKVAKKAS